MYSRAVKERVSNGLRLACCEARWVGAVGCGWVWHCCCRVVSVRLAAHVVQEPVATEGPMEDVLAYCPKGSVDGGVGEPEPYLSKPRPEGDGGGHITERLPLLSGRTGGGGSGEV